MRALLLAALLPGCAHWTKTDTAMEVAFASVTLLDWHQTEKITEYCNETNPVIGQCGERVPVDIFMPVAILAHWGIAAILPPKWRTAWQGIGIGAEVSTTWENYRGRYWEPPTVVVGGTVVPYTHPRL